jgi:hypothetical protein
MGGVGSGRFSRLPTAEACNSLVLRPRDMPLGLEPGGHASVTRIFRADGDIFPIQLMVAWPLDGVAHATLRHETRNRVEHQVSYRIELERAQCRFGGWRWWFRCPATGRRAHKLFLPRGGECFMSRPAYRLAYASQRLDAMGRLQHRKRLVLRKLDGDWEAALRPKGMRHRTYERLLAKLEEVELRIDACFVEGLERIRARHRRGHWWR